MASFLRWEGRWSLDRRPSRIRLGRLEPPNCAEPRDLLGPRIFHYTRPLNFVKRRQNNLWLIRILKKEENKLTKELSDFSLFNMCNFHQFILMRTKGGLVLI